MSDIPAVDARELRAHRRTFVSFERLVLFCVLHVVLALACLALAFIGHEALIAVLLGVGGSLAMISFFVVRATYDVDLDS